MLRHSLFYNVLSISVPTLSLELVDVVARYTIEEATSDERIDDEVTETKALEAEDQQQLEIAKSLILYKNKQTFLWKAASHGWPNTIKYLVNCVDVNFSCSTAIVCMGTHYETFTTPFLEATRYGNPAICSLILKASNSTSICLPSVTDVYTEHDTRGFFTDDDGVIYDPGNYWVTFDRTNIDRNNTPGKNILNNSNLYGLIPLFNKKSKIPIALPKEMKFTTLLADKIKPALKKLWENEPYLGGHRGRFKAVFEATDRCSTPQLLIMLFQSQKAVFQNEPFDATLLNTMQILDANWTDRTKMKNRKNDIFYISRLVTIQDTLADEFSKQASLKTSSAPSTARPR